jgi:hypothetical protein
VESELENAGKDVVMDTVGRYSSLSTKAGFAVERIQHPTKGSLYRLASTRTRRRNAEAM